MSNLLLSNLAVEEGPTKLTIVPPPTPHALDLEQLRALVETLQATVQKLAENFGEQRSQHSTNNNSNNNTNNNDEHNTNDNNNEHTNTTNNNNNNNNHTNTTNNNNNNNDSTTSQESRLSFDLDSADPESIPDLDSPSLVSLNSETGFESLNQHGADLCLGTLGETTRTIGFSLENLDQAMTTQESNNSLDQEGKLIGTCWEPSLDWNPSLDTRRDKNQPRNTTRKRVSFAQASLAYKKEMQEQRRQQNSQLEQLEYNKMMHNKTRSTTKPTQACWNNFQQEQQMQQQPANNWMKKLQHEECTTNNYNLTFGGQSLGSLEQNASTTTCAAWRSPKHQHNINSLGLGTAWGIMIDTGAAISLAPLDFAQHIELSPVECTLQLATATGTKLQTFGRRMVQLCCSNLCLHVSFVVANVSQALIGMDVLQSNQLSLLRGNLGNTALST